MDVMNRSQVDAKQMEETSHAVSVLYVDRGVFGRLEVMDRSVGGNVKRNQLGDKLKDVERVGRHDKRVDAWRWGTLQIELVQS